MASRRRRQQTDDSVTYQQPNTTRSVLSTPITFGNPSHQSLTQQGFEDARRYNPTKILYSGAITNKRGANKLIVKGYQSPFGNSLPAKLQFAIPTRVKLCLQRKIRRQIMFAYKLRNKGSGSKRRRGPYSNISC